MNEDRRKKLKLAITLLDEAKSYVETEKEAEQESFDNLPENMQNGEKAEAMEAAIAQLDEAYGEIENAISSVEQAM